MNKINSLRRLTCTNRWNDERLDVFNLIFCWHLKDKDIKQKNKIFFLVPNAARSTAKVDTIFRHVRCRFFSLACWTS